MSGEGEGAFLLLLGDLLAGKPLRPRYEAPGLLDLAVVPNPYLSGDISVPPGGPVYLETMRGCPNRCTYCYYGKASGRLRRFPEAVTEGVFAEAEKSGAAEIYIMDPSFNAVGNLDERLESLAALNRKGIPLHTELLLESVTPRRAKLLREAGFRSVEVGLQSIHPEVLSKVRRSFDRSRFEAGAGLLIEQGIEVRTGVILGLPGDSLEGFSATLDFVISQGLAPGLEIYPLAVLPGTELRGGAADLGVEYLSSPPYWVTGTPTMPGEDLIRALTLAEDKLGIEYFRPIPPRFSSPPGWIAWADLGLPKTAEGLISRPERMASDLTLLIPGSLLREEREIRRLVSLGETLLAACPFTLYKLVIRRDEFLSPPEVRGAEILAKAFFNPGHPVNEAGVFRSRRETPGSVRLSQLTRRAETALRLADTSKTDSPPKIDPLFLWEGGALSRGGTDLRSYLAGKGFVLYDEESLPVPEKSFLRTAYRDHPAMLLRLNQPISSC